MADARVQYHIVGMSCSFCAETINRAYERTDGVEDVDVSVAHEEVLVQYDDDVVELMDTVRDLGYTVRDPDKEKRFEQQRAELEAGKRDLLIAGGASLVTALVMAVMIARNGWNLFAAAEAAWMTYAPLGFALLTMFWPGWYIKAKAYHSLRRGILNQHVLLEAGAFAGLAGGFLGLHVWRDFPTVHFFAVSTSVTAYHILSEYTSLVVRTRASRAVEGLLDLRPDTARRVTEDGEVEAVEVEDLVEGDRVMAEVLPGVRGGRDGAFRVGGAGKQFRRATRQRRRHQHRLFGRDRGPRRGMSGGRAPRRTAEEQQVVGVAVAVPAVGLDSVLPESFNPFLDGRILVSQFLDGGVAVDVDDVNLPAVTGVDVLEVVHGADDVHVVRNVVALPEELDLSVDVELDEPIDRRRPVQVRGKRFDARFEARFE
jgi:copper chaperone CopZ